MEFQKETGRIYAEKDGELIAEITFPEEDGVAVIDHTFVDDSLRGQGVAGQLVQAALAQIRERGGTPAATCTYAVSWLEKHPEQA